MKLEKDLDPEISAMQDIMRNIKKKKNDLYDKTTIEFVDVSNFQYCSCNFSKLLELRSAVSVIGEYESLCTPVSNPVSPSSLR